MDKLMRDIEADVASISISRTSTTGSASTIRGIGTLTGKGIMAVGNVVVRGIERITIQMRLRTIGEHLQREEAFIPLEVFEDLLELQRIGLYSKSVRFQAWDHLLTLMERRRTSHMVDIILKWPSIEVQLLLRQLSVFKLSGWTLHPARFTFLRPVETNVNATSTSRDGSLAESYRNVFVAILKRDPRLLHDLFTVEEFIFIQTNRAMTFSARHKSNESWGPMASAGSLDGFFDYLSNEHNSTARRKWELPFSADDSIDFLCSGAREQMSEVVDHIVSTLRPFASNEAFPLSTLSLLARHATNPKAEDIHPTLPYLWFALHLISRSDAARELFEEAKLLDVVEQMYICDFPGSGRDRIRELDVAREEMRELVCIFLGVVAVKGGYSPLARRLKDERPRLFVEVFVPFITHYSQVNAFRVQASGDEPPDDKGEFYVALLQYLAANPEAEERTWDVLLGELQLKSELFVRDALLSLSPTEAEIVIRKLIELRLSGRGFRKFVPIPSPTAVDRRTSKGVDFADRMLYLRNILDYIHSQTPEIIHHCADLPMLAVVQSNDYPDSLEDSMTPTDGFGVLFKWLSTMNIYDLFGPCTLTRSTETYIGYIKTAPLGEVEAMVQWLMKVMTSLLSSPGDHVLVENQEDILDIMPGLRELHHPVLPFLQFTIYFTSESLVAAQLFISQGLPSMLLRSNLANLSAEAIQASSYTHTDIDIIHTRFLLLLGSLFSHQSLQQPLRQSLDDTLFKAFLRPLMPNVLSAQLCVRSFLRSTWVDFAPIIRTLVPTEILRLPAIPGGPILSRQPWVHLISYFRNPDNDPRVSAFTKRNITEQLLLFCAAADESEWEPLANLFYTVPSGMMFMYSYIISNYLGCMTRVSHNSEAAVNAQERKAFLCRLMDISKTNGYEMIHPVDRFVSFTASVTRNQRHAVAAVGLDSMLSLLAAVSWGQYDLDVPLTDKQQSKRKRECEWMKFQIMSVKDSTYED